jgi:hypothetical protein
VSSGANFTAYQEIKKLAHRFQPDLDELPSYQHMMIGLISGAMGPFSNAPIDTIKTRSFSCLISLTALAHVPLLFSRSSESHSCTRKVRVPAHCGDNIRHVAPRGNSIDLQGNHAASVESGTGTGYCICCVRESTQDYRVYDSERGGTRQLFGVELDLLCYSSSLQTYIPFFVANTGCLFFLMYFECYVGQDEAEG